MYCQVDVASSKKAKMEGVSGSALGWLSDASTTGDVDEEPVSMALFRMSVVVKINLFENRLIAGENKGKAVPEIEVTIRAREDAIIRYPIRHSGDANLRTEERIAWGDGCMILQRILGKYENARHSPSLYDYVASSDSLRIPNLPAPEFRIVITIQCIVDQQYLK